jgi:hypothetical protein
MASTLIRFNKIHRLQVPTHVVLSDLLIKIHMCQHGHLLTISLSEINPRQAEDVGHLSATPWLPLGWIGRRVYWRTLAESFSLVSFRLDDPRKQNHTTCLSATCMRLICVLTSLSPAETRSLLGSTVGSCWDQPSALAGIDRRLLLGSTVGSCWDRPSELRSARMLNLTQQTEEEEDEQ